MLGTNAQESRIFLAAITAGRATLSIDTFLNTMFPNDAQMQQKLRDAYPVGSDQEFASDFDAASQIATDMAFTCPTGLEANISSNAGFNTWRYVFNASFPNTQVFDGAGVYHASEIPLVFGNLPMGSNTPAPTTEEMQLSNMMQQAWADFAKNPDEGPGWAAVDGNSEESMLGVIGGPENTTGVTEMQVNMVDKRCQLFAEFATATAADSSSSSSSASSSASSAQLTGAASRKATQHAHFAVAVAAFGFAALL